jgi:predicted DNA-binding protein
MGAATIDVHARIPVELAESLVFVSKVTQRTKSNLIYRAIESYLREMLEDYEDVQDVLEREKDPNRVFYTPKEVRDYINTNCRD